MVSAGCGRAAAGSDVVVALLETHDRKDMQQHAEALEFIPPRRIMYRAAQFEEPDYDAVRARHPDLVLVDELAHTNVPGSRHEKRWQDVK